MQNSSHCSNPTENMRESYEPTPKYVPFRSPVMNFRTTAIPDVLNISSSFFNSSSQKVINYSKSVEELVVTFALTADCAQV